MNNTKYAAWTAGLAGLMLFVMLVISLATGITQQEFEFVKPAPEYTAGLLRYSGPLRLIISFDNIFLVAYSLGTWFFCRVLADRGADRNLLRATFAIVIIAGLLDLAENMHILSMLRSSEQMTPLSAAQIELQSVLSAIKWHLAYAAFFVIGLAMRPRNFFEKIFVLSLIVVQMPVGILVYTVPSNELSRIFQIWRYANLLAGFGVIATLSLAYSKDQST